nr:Spo0B domain-containing protein [Desulforadius tongensis]
MPELLEVIQVQRHDFLNHLQVISGLLQLNRGERVKDYIDQITREMAPLSAVTRLKVPELKAVLLIAVHKAKKHQIDFVYNIDTHLDDFAVPGAVLAEAVEECINAAVERLSPAHIEDRRLLFALTERENEFVFKFRLPGLSPGVLAGLEDKLRYSRDLSERDIHAGVAAASNGTEIYLTVPR